MVVNSLWKEIWLHRVPDCFEDGEWKGQREIFHICKSGWSGVVQKTNINNDMMMMMGE